MQTITLTIQEGSEYNLPWPPSHKIGERFVIEHKKAGKVVRTETWILRKHRRGEMEMPRWEKVTK